MRKNTETEKERREDRKTNRLPDTKVNMQVNTDRLTWKRTGRYIDRSIHTNTKVNSGRKIHRDTSRHTYTTNNRYRHIDTNTQVDIYIHTNNRYRHASRHEQT